MSTVAGPVEAVAPEVEAPRPATLAQCHEVIAQQARELAELRQAVAVLAERLTLNSRNSSKPPSSDGPGGGNRAQRRASQRKRGAQKGHPGAWRQALPEEQVDTLEHCVPPPVCECGGAVAVRGEPVVSIQPPPCRIRSQPGGLLLSRWAGAAPASSQPWPCRSTRA